MSNTIHRYKEVIRSSEWWQTNVPILSSFFYLGILLLPVPKAHALNAFLFMFTWAFGAAAFGYFLNEWTDIEEDSKANKKNRAANISLLGRFGILTLCFALAFLPSLLIESWGLRLLILLHLSLFVLYSVPPFRLKNTLLSALVLDSMYAFVMPCFIAISIPYFFQLSIKDNLGILLLISGGIWSFAAGLRNILQHHSKDRKKDIQSGNTNSFNILGKSKFIFLIQWLSIVEIIAFGCFILSINRFTWILFPVFLIYLVDALFYLNPRGKLQTRFLLKWKTGKFNPNFFYEQRWPLALIVLLIYLQPLYLWLLIVHVLFFSPNVKRLYYFFVFAFYKTLVQFYHHVFLKYAYYYGHKLKKLLGIAKVDDQ